MLRFDLVSPEQKLLSDDVAMVTLPGSEGDFSVLPGHAPMISSLRVGFIDVYEKESHGPARRILVSGGIVEVQAGRCTALAEDAVPLAEIDQDALQSDLQRASAKLSLAEAAEKPAIEAQIALLTRKLEVLALAAGQGH